MWLIKFIPYTILFPYIVASSISDDDVHEKLETIWQDDIDTLSRVWLYLAQEKQAFRDSHEEPPSMEHLKRALNKDKIFESYARNLAEDSRKVDNDPTYRRVMEDIYRDYLRPGEEEFDETLHQGFGGANLDENMNTNTFIGLSKGWTKLPRSVRQDLLKSLSTFMKTNYLGHYSKEVVSLLGKKSVGKWSSLLAGVDLAIEDIRSIYRWWQGEISGKRCLKIIIDKNMAVAGGLAGAWAGAAAGSVFGPVGTLIGGAAGGIGGGIAGHCIIDRLTQQIFNLPKEEALENAYRHLGVYPSSSNDDINHAYRALVLKYHPDKGGNKDDFLHLQISMQIIKIARKQVY